MGYNVEYISADPDEEGFFEMALMGYGTLFITSVIGAANPVAGFMLEAALVSVALAPALARALYPAHELDYDYAGESDDVAYVNASGAPAGTWGWPVDACLGDLFEWVFMDDNVMDHSVTVTAELEYYSHEIADFVTITTSVDLNVLIGQYTLSISSSPTNGGTTNPSAGTHYYYYGDDETVWANPDYVYEFLYWRLDGDIVGYDLSYEVTMKSDHTLKACFNWLGGGGPGGGCPFVSTWTGTDYVLDNNLLLASEASNGTNVVDYYVLQQPLVPDVDGIYRLLLSEFENEHDFFDHVQLIAVDHSSDVNVAVSPYGEALTYTEPSPPVSAIDDNKKKCETTSW